MANSGIVAAEGGEEEEGEGEGGGGGGEEEERGGEEEKEEAEATAAAEEELVSSAPPEPTFCAGEWMFCDVRCGRCVRAHENKNIFITNTPLCCGNVTKQLLITARCLWQTKSVV